MTLPLPSSALPAGSPDASPVPLANELHHVLAQIPAIVSRMTPAGVFTYVNRVVAGLRLEDVLGRSVLEFVGADDRGALQEHIARAVRTGEPVEYEMCGVGPHGQPTWYFTRLAPVLRDGQVVELLGVTTDITARRNAEEGLRESQRTLASLMASFPGMFYRRKPGPSWVIEFASPYFRTLTGHPIDALVKGRVSFGDLIHLEDRPRVRDQLDIAVRERRPYEIEYRIQTIDGREKHVWDRGEGTYSASGRLLALEGVLIDITERKRLEEQLQRAQKVESIGRLAGGLAHDFSNLLTAILGFTDLASLNLPEDSPAQADLKNVRSVAQRGTALTRHLLAFARRQRSQPRPFRLGDLVAGAERMLRRLMGENVELVVSAQTQEDVVEADPTQVEQVLLNLVVNARDAMPNGGRLLIAIGAATLSEGDARETPEAMPGAYVVLTVQDNGVGMTEDVRRHAFEPFFTTKTAERGTGLGLATSYGIVRQNGGHIRVFSRPGEGTRFEILLPRHAGSPEALEAPLGPGRIPRGEETVLVAEDDPLVRDTMVRTLSDSGYRVMAAEDGEAALERSRTHEGKLDLLVCDVVMPRLGGPDLVERLRRTRPGLKVLYVSGHSMQAIPREEDREPHAEFLQKPFMPVELLQRVRSILHPGRR